MSDTLMKVTYKKVGRDIGVDIYDVVFYYENGDMGYERHDDDTMGNIQWMCTGRNVPFVKVE